MQFSHDKTSNTMYIQFSDEIVKNSEEISEGIIIDYGLGENIIGLEILNFSKRKIDLNEIIKLESDEIIAKLLKSRKNPFKFIGIWEGWDKFDLFEKGINLTKNIDKNKTVKIVDSWKN